MKILMAIGWADIPVRILQISMCFASFLLADWKIEITVTFLLCSCRLYLFDSGNAGVVAESRQIRCGFWFCLDEINKIM